jgi:hypothetical protein
MAEFCVTASSLLDRGAELFEFFTKSRNRRVGDHLLHDEYATRSQACEVL